jgi:thymidylate synthase
MESAFGIGELCWHLSGSNDVSSVAFYAPRWKRFSDDGVTIAGSCYGRRGRSGTEPNQWERLIDLLRADPSSRRAVLNFQPSPSEGLMPNAVDVACATVLQFFIRSNAVDAVVYMRSNDVIWGLPYDVFFFTMLQEILAETLGLELGTYHHIAGSFHLYSYHFELAQNILSYNNLTAFEMPRMTSISSISDFVHAEQMMRNGEDYELESIPKYWRQLLQIVELKIGSRLTSPNELRNVTSGPYVDVIRPLMIESQAS